MNLAPLGKLYRDGQIDTFGCHALLTSEGLSNKRIQMFFYRWGVWNGKFTDSHGGLWLMIQNDASVWNRLPFPLPVCGKDC